MSKRPSSTNEPPDRVFFTDRDLGRKILPGILREAGVRVEIHDDHFEQDTPDEVWLPSVASRDWIALTHNKRIRYSSLETEILMAAGLRTFVLVGGGPHQKLGEGFVRSLRMVHRFLDRHIGPFIAKVYCNSGKVEMWLSEPQWVKRRGRRTTRL